MVLNPIDFVQFQTIIFKAISQAEDILLHYFRNNTPPHENKTNKGWDPVSIADKEAESIIISVIESHYPDHNIFSEEAGHMNKGSDYEWVIDPIDGTKAYLLGIPIWGTLIGLSYQKKPLFGCMAQPFIQEFFIGDSQKAFHIKNNKRTRLFINKSQKEIKTMKMVCTTPDMFFQTPQKKWFNTLHSQVMTTRYGTDCYGYISIVMNGADLLFEADIASYDYLPLLPIITGAGGVYQTISLPHQVKDTIFVARSRDILEKVLDFLQIN